MRVNPNPMPDLLAALNQTQLEAQEAALQISTGKSVNEPSDNPTAAGLLVENNDQATFNSGYLQSISAVQGQLSTADSTLSSVTSALQQAISLGVEGANGTVSASDQAAIVTQLQGIQSQLVSLANTTYQGNYVFGGSITNTAPYVVDDASPSGVHYVGNSDINEVSIGNGYKLAVNQPGSQLFSAPGNDVFLAINNLIQALQTNAGISTAVNAVSAASSYLSAQAVFYGNATDQTQSRTTYLNAAQLQISQQQNTLGGVNLPTAANNLDQANTDTQAALAAISKFSQNNLFEYLQ
ncbi:MAG TPA: flagellar hook-associated protein FlgL [Terriglobales bacterium]|jgi:flagellar hook-associated protein 3 FlgL|nr:flagellar hook-associated protein FlgL [Terriglobales bacterium]